MDDADSDRPRLNAYGKVSLSCLLAGGGSLLLGAGGFATGFFVLAVGVLLVAMRRNARADEGERSQSEDDESGTDETEMKAKAMAGGEAGHG